MKKPSPYPWRVKWQYRDFGRPRKAEEILDSQGKKVRLSRPANAVLMGRAPEMFALLQRMQQRMIYMLAVVRNHPDAGPWYKAPEIKDLIALVSEIERELY